MKSIDVSVPGEEAIAKMVSGILADITDAVSNLEEARTCSQVLHLAVLTSLHAHIAIVDRAGVIIEVNESWSQFARQNGVVNAGKAFLGCNYLDICLAAAAPGDRSSLDALNGIRMVLDGASSRFVLEYPCHAPSEKRWFEMTVEPLKRPEGGAVISHISITARKLAEIELREQRQRLAHMGRIASLGEIAAGLAHELNQPLTASLSSAQAALRFLDHSPPSLDQVRNLLQAVVQQDRRARDVIDRLRKMIKGDEPNFETLDVNEQIRDAITFARSDLAFKDVTIVELLKPKMPPIQGDRVQLQQVLMNLLTNAAEAMIQLSPEDRILSIISSCPSTGGVQIRVSDAGCGIPKDRLSAIFEPFVTSKKQGLGLGLSICRTIALNHNGELFAANNPERGASLCLRLPA